MIGLAGAHRTGKTTLARSFSEESGISFIETSTSEVFKQLGFDPKADYDFKLRLFIQGHILTAAENLYKSIEGGAFITDRTPLDMLAYTMADIQRQNVDADGEAMFMDYVERCFEVTNRFFASIVVVKPGIPLVEEEGKAPNNKAYIEHINSLVLGLTVDERMKAERHFIGRGTLDMNDRIRAMNNVVTIVCDRHERNTAGKSFH